MRDTLSPIGDKRPAHVPLAINHDIDGLGCVVRPDGILLLERSPRPMVTLEPRHAYALAMFMRSPAVAALLEARHAARMTGSELGFQQDQAEEAVRMASAR